jgi:hypothetical protein
MRYSNVPFCWRRANLDIPSLNPISLSYTSAVTLTVYTIFNVYNFDLLFHQEYRSCPVQAALRDSCNSIFSHFETFREDINNVLCIQKLQTVVKIRECVLTHSFYIVSLDFTRFIFLLPSCSLCWPLFLLFAFFCHSPFLPVYLFGALLS